jgi:predicted hotdog family 3-hydroxylacyl-ACP dehydratase
MTAPTVLDRDAVARLVPHQGRMCLLDRIEAWDAVRIRARARGHRAPDHPLRLDGALDAVCAIEYAAQAMAAHGRLAAADGAAPQAGYIAAVRDVHLAVPRLDRIAGDLVIDCEQLAGDARQAAYRFTLSDEAGTALASGRITVVLEPAGGRG